MCSLSSQVLLLLAVVAAAYADKPQTGYGVPVGVQLFRLLVGRLYM